MITITILSIIWVLWILSDTITEYLCEGESFAPNETKGFR